MSPRLIDSEAILSMNQQAEEIVETKQNQLKVGDRIIINPACILSEGWYESMIRDAGAGPFYTVSQILGVIDETGFREWGPIIHVEGSDKHLEEIFFFKVPNF